MQSAKRKGPGRPKLMANTKRIIVQIDDTQLKTIQGVCRNKNISVSSFLRNAADYFLENAYDDHNIDY